MKPGVFKFISFAVWWIRQSILYAISEKLRMIRLPMNQLNALANLNKYSGELEGRLERQPTFKELAEIAGWTEERIKSTNIGNVHTMSYNVSISNQGEYTLLENLTDGNQEMPDQMLIHSDEADLAYRLLDGLSEKERKIVEMIYGIGRDIEALPSHAGKMLGMSGERVRQIKCEALKKLRQKAEILK